MLPYHFMSLYQVCTKEHSEFHSSVSCTGLPSWEFIWGTIVPFYECCEFILMYLTE